MSLTVPTQLIEQDEAGDIRPDDFLQCIKESLPYAWQLIEGLVDRLQSGTERFADNRVPPSSEQARGQTPPGPGKGCHAHSARATLRDQTCFPELPPRGGIQK